MIRKMADQQGVSTAGDCDGNQNVDGHPYNGDDQQVADGVEQQEKQQQNGAPMNASNVREGDWSCSNCGANVFGRNISCFRCQAPKPGSNARPGDWLCLNKGCGAHNYAKRQTCYRCQVPKGSEKPGDWICSNCHSNNFGSRQECFRCRVPRPPGYTPAVLSSVRPGDWLCPNPACAANVFANRSTCFRCNTPRPSDAEVAAMLSSVRPGDWTCSNCTAVCYASRQACFRCETPRRPEDGRLPTDIQQHQMNSGGAYGYMPPQGAGYGGKGFYPYAHQHQIQQHMPGTVVGAPRPRDGDWACGKCSESNFARRNVCFKCQEPRSVKANSQ